MNEQTIKLIEEMAHKLGTTTEYLWGILIKQATVQAYMGLFFILLIAIFNYVLYKVHKRLMEIKDYGDYKKSGYSYYGDNAKIPMGIALVIHCLLIIGALCSIETVINGFFNPEYWALDKVLNYVK